MNTNPKALRGYAYSSCRLLGHAWHEVPSDWTPEPGGVPMTVRCERCDMERRDTVGRHTGEVVSRHYTYPTGYQFHHDDDGDVLPSRQDFRMLWINDAIRVQRELRKRHNNNNRKAG